MEIGFGQGMDGHEDGVEVVKPVGEGGECALCQEGQSYFEPRQKKNE